MKRTWKDVFVIGFALFSMFFGAGNVVFPPYLGLESGNQWFLGFLCYYLADIGLALLALFAILRQGGSDGITRPLGRGPATVLMCAIILCIGPMLAIPRTAATTYEMSLAPLVSGFSPVLFSVLFFAVIFLLCVKESAVVDIVGKVLTPALLLGLLILIVKGVVDPIGPVPAKALVDNVPATGIEAGYQTMDVLAAMVFGIIVLKSAEAKGHTRFGDKFTVVAGAGIVAGAALLVVYLGLTYLGVTTSRFFDLTVNRTYLVVSIVRTSWVLQAWCCFPLWWPWPASPRQWPWSVPPPPTSPSSPADGCPTAWWLRWCACSAPWCPTSAWTRSFPSPPLFWTWSIPLP